MFKKLIKAVTKWIKAIFDKEELEEFLYGIDAEYDEGKAAVETPKPIVADKVTDEPKTETAKPADVVRGDDVNFDELNFCWGGFNGGKAKRVDNVEIGGLSVKSSGMSYKWVKYGCEGLGAASGDDYSQTLACLFVRIGGKWQGGKFDWISTSRRTRDFKNIAEGYNGWRKDAIQAADGYAFVIVSKDGKKRTNAISSVVG